jgi:Protein of unknown function (DUF2484)
VTLQLALSLGLCAVWLIAANVIAMFPSRDYHWRSAYVMIAIGVPLLGWVSWEGGPVLGLLIMAAGASVLRWPVVYFLRWLRRLVR